MNGFHWSCPRCRGKLVSGGVEWSCLRCKTRFRALRGIPDLRTGEDLYLANADDWAFARALDADYDRRDFRGLLDLYFERSVDLTPDQKRRQITHILTAPGRTRTWMRGLGTIHAGPVLDLGCGSGSFLAAIGREVPEVVGVDIAMRWLMVARKRLDEEGLGRIPLACASAEGLPLQDNRLAAVVAGDVIEHVADQGTTLAEAFRVLAPGGRLFLASPNRFSLAPEPHVGVWGVGFMPRQWMPAYVRWVRKVDFRAIRTLGYAEWRRSLDVSPFGGGTITVPRLPEDDLEHFGPGKRALARVYNVAVATGIGRRLARAFGPLFHVVCDKPAAGVGVPHRSSRATRRRSKPSAGRA